MRSGALPLLALLLLLAPAAAAENLATLEAAAREAPVLKPGEQGEVKVDVQYCYNAPPLAPANVDVAIGSAPAWLSVQPNPARFRADTGGQRCGSKEVALQFTMGRDAPAFEPGSVTATLTAPGESLSVTAVIQAAYWAEVQLAKPNRIRVERGDLGTLSLAITVGANQGTRLEITGNDPDRLLNLQGKVVTVGGAGEGLDAKVTQRESLTVTASPAAKGLRTISILVASQYAQSPSTVGEAKTVTAEVEVTEPASTPAPGAALLAAGAVAAALLARRRGKR